MQLSRDVIAEAGLAVLQEEGLDKVTLRAIAKRLGIQAPSIYWYVTDKADLTALMAEVFYHSAMANVPPTSSWREWLRAFANGMRAKLVEYRDSGRLCAGSCVASDETEATVEWMVAPLEQLGLPRRQALIYLSAIISLTVGWVIFEQNKSFTLSMRDLVSFGDGFSTGLDALVEGLRAPEQDQAHGVHAERAFVEVSASTAPHAPTSAHRVV